TIDGKLPTALPEHPSSIEYVKARKAAVIEWNKAYKAKGRDLPAVALDSERKFQDAHRDINEPSQNSTQDNSQTRSANNQSVPTDAGTKSNQTQRVTGNKSKTAEKKLEEATIKSVANLIKEVDKYRSTKPAGDTTLERDLANRTAKEAITRFVENQPDYFFTYPIRDVSGVRSALVFDVDEPIELEPLRRELGEGLQLTNHCKSIRVDNAAILKMSSSIKPGDLLRVRFKVRFGSTPNDMGEFSVFHAAALGDQSRGQGESFFGKKAILGYQLVKQPAKTETSP
ncbi:MAG TPA: hypothetical protein VM260_01315, partial [Pirellula sp.]|nr:hypothetical protein [Pirellula sp.]